jgi:hypothetical protein
MLHTGRYIPYMQNLLNKFVSYKECYTLAVNVQL